MDVYSHWKKLSTLLVAEIENIALLRYTLWGINLILYSINKGMLSKCKFNTSDFQVWSVRPALF
jgi:hypothetical protein